MRKQVPPILAGVLLCLMLLACDDDCPTCPEPAQDTEKHYPLYAYIGWPYVAGYMAAFDAPADTILDTVETAMVPYSLTLNADLSKIVISSTAPPSVLIYDVETLQLDTTFDFYADFYFDRQRGIGVRTSLNSVAKVDGVTLEVLASMETPTFIEAQIDTTNGIIYAVPMSQLGRIHRIDYATMTVIDTLVIVDQFDNTIAIHRPLPIAAHDRLYFTGRPWGSVYGRIYAYDLVSRQIVFDLSMRVPAMPHGDLVYDGQRERVYVCEPGQAFFDRPPADGIFVFDVLGDSLETMLPVQVSVPWTASPQIAAVLNLAMTPDGKYLYASCEGAYPLMRWDLNQPSLIDHALYLTSEASNMFMVSDFVFGEELK